MTQVNVRTDDGAVSEWYDLPHIPQRDDEIDVDVTDAAGAVSTVLFRVGRVRWEPLGTVEQEASHVVLTIEAVEEKKPAKPKPDKPHPWKS